jgi:hypothetical protein
VSYEHDRAWWKSFVGNVLVDPDKWLDSRNPQFGGKTPWEYVCSDPLNGPATRKVVGFINALAEGVHA